MTESVTTLDGIAAFVRQLPSPVALYRGPEHVFVAVSDSYRAIIGGRDPTGLPFAEGLPELREQGFPSLLDAVYATGNSHSDHSVPAFWDQDGDGIAEHGFIDFVYSPVRAPSGEIWGVVAQVTDVTERVRAEAELRVNEERFRGTFTSSGLGMALVGLDGVPLEINPALSCMLGFASPAEMAAITIDQVTHPEDRGKDWELFTSLLERRRSSYTLEKRYLRRDGGIMWGRLTVSLVRDEAGEPQHAIALVEDITDRKRHETAQEVLAECSELLASTFDYHRTMKSVADLVAARAADWCIIREIPAEGQTGTLAEAAGTSADAATIAAIRGEVLSWSEGNNGRRAVPDPREGSESQSPADGTIELDRPVDGTSKLALPVAVPLNSLPNHSVVRVPLIARGHLIGEMIVAFLGISRSGHIPDPRDGPGLDLLQELGRRIAIAIDNAQLFRQAEQARRLAERHAEELATQASELHAQTAQLQTSRAELSAAYDELQRSARMLADRTTEIEEARAALDAFFDAAPVPAGIVDTELRYRRINSALAAIDGVTPESVIGRKLEEVVPEMYPFIAPLYEQVIRTGEPIKNLELSGFVSSSPTVKRHFVVSYFPIRPGGGPVSGVGLVGLDVTEQKVAEKARAEQALVVETLHRIGQTLTGNLDLKRVVQEVTESGNALTGAEFGAFFYNVVDEAGESYTLYTVAGVPRERFSNFPMPRNTPVFGPTFRGDEVVRSDDITKDPRYGQVAPYHGMPPGHLPVRSYLAVPVISRSGAVIGGLFYGHPEPAKFNDRHEGLLVGLAAWAAVAMDNAQLYEAERRARDDAERANRAKRDFLTTMSHELRTPLNAMLGYTDLLLAGIPEAIGEGPQQKVARIGFSARHLLALIEEILSFSRLEAGEEKVELSRVDVDELMEEVQTLMEPLALARGLELRFKSMEAPLFFISDPRKVRQILINLVANALKFTREGRVEVELGRQGDRVYFKVTDTGPGISEADQERIFEPFWQADQGMTRSEGGTGLGLTVSRRLARLLEGDLSVQSLAGEGSTFTFDIPFR